MKKDEKRKSSRRGRPLRFWLLWVVFVLFTLAGWARMINSIINYYWLNLVGVFPPPMYIIVTGALWGIAGLVVVVWMALGRRGYRTAGLTAALFFALTYWADRLLFSHAPGDQANLPFALLMTLLGLGYVLFVLRPFGERRALRGSRRAEETPVALNRSEET